MPWDCHLGSPHALGVEEMSMCDVYLGLVSGVDIGHGLTLFWWVFLYVF
jgi:hypothetical protein